MSVGDAKGAGGADVRAGGVLRRRTAEEWDRIVQESFGSDLAVGEVVGAVGTVPNCQSPNVP